VIDNHASMEAVVEHLVTCTVDGASLFWAGRLITKKG
jgi:hypothetical protein